MESTYLVVVAGQMPLNLSQAVQDRFGDVRLATGGRHTVIECSVSDQSELRALLTQLWDVGGEVVLVSQAFTESTRRHDGPVQY